MNKTTCFWGNNNVQPAFAIILLLSFSQTGHSDGFVIDKIYHPYVEAMTKELEWRMVYQDEHDYSPDNSQLHRFAFGQAITDRWFAEMYLNVSKIPGKSFDTESVELELIHQLTEQGEYWLDWGVVFELEKEIGEDIWEAGVGILAEKEAGRWSLTTNLIVTEEWGDDIEDELESRLALQARYRFSQQFEPALELHKGENTFALGPAIMGDINAGVRRSWHWEAGLLLGLDNDSPQHTIRAGIEYEF
jgi:hypothetical protein